MVRLIRLDVVMPPLSYEIQDAVEKFKYPLIPLLVVELIIAAVVIHKLRQKRRRDRDTTENREDNDNGFL